MVFPSSLYTVPVLANLLETLDCKTILTTVNRPKIVSEFISAHPTRTIDFLSVKEILEKDRPEYKYIRTYTEAQNEPFVVIPTSGTTGRPKPIVWTNAWVANYIQQFSLQPPPGFRSMDIFHQGTRGFNMLPVMHVC